MAYADRNVMKIYCEVNDENVRRAASLVMKHYADSQFIERIKNVEKFNHTPFSSHEVSKMLPKLMSVSSTIIKPYKTLNPFSSVIGHAADGIIYVNTRKLGLPLYDRVGNIFHETTHLVGFSHKGNRPDAYNLRSVPYLSAAIFARYTQEIYG
jgi:hypothetical protein